MSNDGIKALEEKIAILKRQWPAHSVSPTMLQQLDELEEALKRALKEAGQDEAEAGAQPSEV